MIIPIKNNKIRIRWYNISLKIPLAFFRILDTGFSVSPGLKVISSYFIIIKSCMANYQQKDYKRESN